MAPVLCHDHNIVQPCGLDIEQYIIWQSRASGSARVCVVLVCVRARIFVCVCAAVLVLRLCACVHACTSTTRTVDIACVSSLCARLQRLQRKCSSKTANYNPRQRLDEMG
jgi:hypothetical protein